MGGWNLILLFDHWLLDSEAFCTTGITFLSSKEFIEDIAEVGWQSWWWSPWWKQWWWWRSPWWKQKLWCSTLKATCRRWESARGSFLRVFWSKSQAVAGLLEAPRVGCHSPFLDELGIIVMMIFQQKVLSQPVELNIIMMVLKQTNLTQLFDISLSAFRFPKDEEPKLINSENGYTWRCL